MKRIILAALAIFTTLPTAISLQAQDDVYYTRKNARETTYRAMTADQWSTDANDDWDVDSYNRRSSALDQQLDSIMQAVTASDSVYMAAAAAEPIHDTVYVVEPYRYSDRIRRFYTPMFNYWMFDPMYDVGFYDPFYWDYAYWDPWWYCTPSFGYHWGNWWNCWDYGYYTGWYGGWYSPWFHPQAHHWYPGDSGHGRHRENVNGPQLANRQRRGMRNNNGAHFRHADMGTRARSNRSTQMGARPVGQRGQRGQNAGLATRGTGNGTSAARTMRQNSNLYGGARHTRTSASRATASSGSSTRGGYYNNSASRRGSNGIRQDSNGHSTSSRSTGYSAIGGPSRGAGQGGYSGSYSRNSSSRSSGSSGSSSSSRSSSFSSGSSHSSGSSYSGGSSSGGSYSGGGGGGSHGGGGGGGGSHSGGGRR